MAEPGHSHCSVEGCERPRWVHGLCAAHNKRRAAGRPIEGPICAKSTLLERLDPAALFWSRVDRTGGPDACWPWLLHVDDDGLGYGAASWTDENGRRVSMRAHRAAFLLANGFVPSGRRKGDVLVRHTCDFRPCCNPRHLILGTHKDNYEDSRERGRAVYPPTMSGAANPLFKLTDEKLARIAELKATGACIASITRHVGLGWTTVNRALSGAPRHA